MSDMEIMAPSRETLAEWKDGLAAVRYTGRPIEADVGGRKVTWDDWRTGHVRCGVKDLAALVNVPSTVPDKAERLQQAYESLARGSTKEVQDALEAARQLLPPEQCAGLHIDEERLGLLQRGVWPGADMFVEAAGVRRSLGVRSKDPTAEKGRAEALESAAYRHLANFDVEDVRRAIVGSAGRAGFSERDCASALGFDDGRHIAARVEVLAGYLEAEKELARPPRDSADIFEQALTRTTFTKSSLEMLHAKIAESPKKDGVITLTTTAEIDGISIGEPYKAIAVIKGGRIHRDNGPAVVIDDVAFTASGDLKEGKTVLFMRDGMPHRDDGPAVLSASGDVLWMREGKLHRENGPAALVNGDPIFAIRGKAMTPEEFGRATGLGSPGQDWMVEPNTGTMITGLTHGFPTVAKMRDVVPEPAVAVELQAGRGDEPPERQDTGQAKIRQRGRGPEL
ncbi:MAG: hypothetical protein M0T84_07060 [Betaproteobacteria bacterium]|nr:hypothetical protein [Betaproteobacteria bacterium]